MIYADIYFDGSFLKGFIIKGHAGMAEAGEDIVCAGVSVLAQTALLGLDAYLTVKPSWRLDDEGYLECWLPEGLSPEEMTKAQVIMHTMELGLLCMEESYGQYLKVSKRRWTKCC